MRVLVAGATGAVGKPLVAALVAAGHEVFGTTRSRDKFASLRAEGADPIQLDGLDAWAVMRVVSGLRPDAIVHQMTSLSSMHSTRHFDDKFAMTNRLRTEGTRYLLAAARAANTRFFVAQSYAGWTNAREGHRIKTEDDPLDDHPPATMRKTLAAIRTHESLVLDASGVRGTVLRFGSLYGPGTSIAEDGEIVEMVRKRRLPVVGDGAGVWSFLHVHDAATATVRALHRDRPGVYNIVDDEPIEVRTWVPELARAIGANPPRHVPAWVGRVLLGEAGLLMMTRARGSSNARARATFEWEPRYPSVRVGFREGLGEPRISHAA